MIEATMCPGFGARGFRPSAKKKWWPATTCRHQASGRASSGMWSQSRRSPEESKPMSWPGDRTPRQNTRHSKVAAGRGVLPACWRRKRYSRRSPGRAGDHAHFSRTVRRHVFLVPSARPLPHGWRRSVNALEAAGVAVRSKRTSTSGGPSPSGGTSQNRSA